MNGLIIFKNAGLGGIERSFLKFFSSSFYHESQVLAQPGDELDARYQVSQTEDKEFLVNIRLMAPLPGKPVKGSNPWL